MHFKEKKRPSMLEEMVSQLKNHKLCEGYWQCQFDIGSIYRTLDQYYRLLLIVYTGGTPFLYTAPFFVHFFEEFVFCLWTPFFNTPEKISWIIPIYAVFKQKYGMWVCKVVQLRGSLVKRVESQIDDDALEFT